MAQAVQDLAFELSVFLWFPSRLEINVIVDDVDVGKGSGGTSTNIEDDVVDEHDQRTPVQALFEDVAVALRWQI